MKRWLTWPWLLFYALLLLLFAAYYVPKISAERYREPIRAGLENALGRRVQMGEVQFRLLPVPGFTITNVIIGEDPAIGPEPIAYVTTLRGRPGLSALFGGPLEFASVDLEDTSLNLTRIDVAGGTAEGNLVRWNFSSLMRPRLLASFPSVHMLGGRVNFKFGDTKSVFYLLNTDVDLWPPSRDSGPWTLRLSAEPARTDRPSRGFGRFSGRGEWQPAKALVTLDIKLEKSELGDMVTLFRGRESDLHGHIWGDAHLGGPLTRIGLTGRLRLDDIHAWNQTPPGGSAWPISLSGAIDIPAQSIDIRATTEGKQPPLDVRYRVTSYLARPRWAVTALFSQLPIAPLIGIARNMGARIPPDVRLEGMAQGAVGYSVPAGNPRLDGQVVIASATLAVGSAPQLQVSNAQLQFAGSSVKLGSASIINSEGQSATLSGNFDLDAQKLAVSLQSEGMAISSFRSQMSLARVPVLSLATSGTWNGQLYFSSLPEPLWSGDFAVKEADVPIEAFALPLHIIVAEASIGSAGLATKRLSFGLGGIEGQGEYWYETGSAHPHRFRITMARTDAAELEKLLLPTLHRGSFLSNALHFGKTLPEPDWMLAMHADGTLQIAALDIGGKLYKKLKSRVIWDGDHVQFTSLQGYLEDAAFKGSATVDMALRQPHYKLDGTITGFPLRTGRLDAEGTLTTSGIGPELLLNLRAQGSVRGHNLELAPANATEGTAVWDRVEGSFEWTWSSRKPHLKFGQLVMTNAGETFEGSAETQTDGQVLLRATDGTKKIQGFIQ